MRRTTAALARTCRVLLAVALATLVLGGCEVFGPEISPSPSPAPLLSGIRGTVLLGPTCGGPSRGAPCTTPYAARLVILDANDDVVGEVTSGADGRFEIALPPGIYTIQPVSPSDAPFPYGQPISVTVGEEEYTEVGVDYDTGIR